MQKYNHAYRRTQTAENALLPLFFHGNSYSNLHPLTFLQLLYTKTFLAACPCFQTNLLIDDNKSLITSFTNLMKRRSLKLLHQLQYLGTLKWPTLIRSCGPGESNGKRTYGIIWGRKETNSVIERALIGSLM